MAWKKISTTLGKGHYPRQVGRLFDNFSSSMSGKYKNNLRVTEGKNSLNLDLYAINGIDVAAELDITKDQFDSVCSTLPSILSGTRTYENKDEKEYRRISLNLGRVLTDEAGNETVRFAEHVAYKPHEGNYLVSVVLPGNVKSKIERYGKGSLIDSDLPEASIALLIADAARKEDFKNPEQVYDCTKPVCPQKEVAGSELIELIKRSPNVKLEGHYLKGGRVFHDSEDVLVDMTPTHISVDGLSDVKPEFNSRQVLYPLFNSTGFEFGLDAEIEFKEKHTGRLKSGCRRLKNIDRAEGTAGKVYRAGKTVAGVGVAALSVPFAVAYLLGDSLYYCTAKPYLDERKQRKNFYERTLTKGIELPDEGEAGCVCVADKTCINRKYEEKKKAGLLPNKE